MLQFIADGVMSMQELAIVSFRVNVNWKNVSHGHICVSKIVGRGK